MDAVPGAAMIYIWLVQEYTKNYDQYDSFIAAAETEEQVRHIHPDGYKWTSEGWPWWTSTWPVKPEDAKVTKLGTAEPSIESGTVLLASYNAG
jgi:hypothetical protein